MCYEMDVEYLKRIKHFMNNENRNIISCHAEICRTKKEVERSTVYEKIYLIFLYAYVSELKHRPLKFGEVYFVSYGIKFIEKLYICKT